MRTSRYAFAYMLVTMLSAALDDGYAGPTSVDSNRFGSVVTANEPMPLDTFTITGAASDKRETHGQSTGT
jgi:hypothetical protein